jgi:CheY-like chemotaxis protein
MSPIRVLLVDDHLLIRAGTCSLRQTVGGVAVVAVAGDDREGLRLIEAHRPDVVLLDVVMPRRLARTSRLGRLRTPRPFPHGSRRSRTKVQAATGVGVPLTPRSFRPSPPGFSALTPRLSLIASTRCVSHNTITSDD